MTASASRKNASPSVIPADAKLANVKGRAERLTILRALDTADDLMGSTLLQALRMTAEYGPTSVDEVKEGYTRCNSPAVYASTFNRGAKAADVIGVGAALALIEKFDGKVGGYRQAVDALGSVIQQAKDAGSKTLAPKAARMAVQTAVKVAADKAAGKKEAKAAAKRGPVVRKATQVKAAALSIASGNGFKEMSAFLTYASNAASRMPPAEGRETLQREANAALAKACELFHVLAK